ncbi:MAG: substrate-binding domain-containing protein [Lachnospiraceae bacterium]|nr:substrate-binding domain-containing protein [Lachnospiraceae bacterium]
MKKIKRYRELLIIAVLLLVFLVAALSQTKIPSPKLTNEKRVSLIVYGDDSERWENLRQGAGLVCENNDAGLSLLTMLSENDVAEQEEIIEREIENGADALIIAPVNSAQIRDYIINRKISIPVAFVESVESCGKDQTDIAPDDYRMGYELGEKLVENESDIVTVAVVSNNTERDSVALREKGLMDAIEGKVGKILTWSRSEYNNKTETRVFIQKSLVSEATDVIVTFDNSTTDALLDALTNLNKQSKQYSVSTSNKAVYNLYSREILSLGYPNEYAMGYLAAENVLDRSYAKKAYSDKEIEYRIIRKENMYDEDNQTLLFPFVN